MCRDDHGLTWAEFEALTLPEWEALEERRMVRIRHARFNAALLTSMYFNANSGADTEPVEVWDFIPGYQRDPEEREAEKKRKAIKQGIVVAFSSMHGKTVEQVRADARQMIANLTRNGTDADEAEEIVSSAFESVIKQPL